MGLRKVNVFQHPDVSSIKEWVPFLREELLGIAAVDVMPNEVTAEYAEIHFRDDQGGTLSVRHGADDAQFSKYRLDLDYWNEHPVRLTDATKIGDELQEYAKSMTSFFHWCLKKPMYEFLRPTPRMD